MMMDDQARHALSSIDLLPEAATADINWAIAQLDEGRRTDSDVLFEFNDRLAVIGIEPISKSAFGRFALRKRKIFGARNEFTMVSNAFKQEYGAERTDTLTQMLVQMLMTVIYQIIAEGKSGAKEVLSMSKSVQSLLIAQRISTGEKKKEGKQKADDDKAIKASMDGVFKAAETAMETNGQLEGLEYVKKIRADVYQIFDDEPQAVTETVEVAGP